MFPYQVHWNNSIIKKQFLKIQNVYKVSFFMLRCLEANRTKKNIISSCYFPGFFTVHRGHDLLQEFAVIKQFLQPSRANVRVS